MNPIFSKKEVLSILNSTEMYGDYTLRENSLDSRMFTEAVKQGEDIAEQLVGVDTDVQKALAKITTIQESISKNILYNAIVYNNEGGLYLPKTEVETFNFTNLANTSIPRVLNLKNALDSAAEKLFPNGVSVGRNVISIKNQNDADMFYRVMKATCKSIKEKKANISAELFNDSSIVDSNDLSVKAYAYYRGGDVVSRKVVKCDAQEIKTRKALAEKLGVVVKNYDDSCIAVCTSLTNLVKKLSTPVEFYNKQTQNQLEYLKNKLKRLFICYTVEYLYRANLVYAAHADAISEYFTVFSKNKDKALVERPVSTTVDGDILSNMESTISLDESFDDFEATDDYKRNVEFFDGRMYNTVGDYLHMNSMLESYIDEFYKAFVQEAIGDTANNLANKLNTAANKANTAAKAAEATGDSNTRFRKIWAAFLNFMNNIVNKFRTSMDQRIKNCSEFIDANQQKILENAKVIPGTVERPNYGEGLKLINSVKMPEAKTVLDPAATGTLTSVDQIGAMVKFGNAEWNPKTNKESFVDFAKNMFITGGTKPQTVALNSLNVQDMMKFCKDATGYNNLANALKDDLDAVSNATTDKLTQLASQQKVSNQAKEIQESKTENAVFKRYDNIESFIENYLDAYQEAEKEGTATSSKGKNKQDSGGETQDDKGQTISGVNTSGSGENAKSDFSKTVIGASTNFQNVLKSFHTSKLTAYEYIYVKYMEVLRVIANYNPNTQPAENNNNQQNNAQ